MKDLVSIQKHCHLVCFLLLKSFQEIEKIPAKVKIPPTLPLYLYYYYYFKVDLFDFLVFAQLEVVIVPAAIQ